MKCLSRCVAALFLVAFQLACDGGTPVGPGSTEAIFSIGPPPGTPISSQAARPPLCRGAAGHLVVGFEDANLEAAVRSALGVGNGDALTCSLLSGLTFLNARDLGIQSLVGIGNLTRLTGLNLSENSITDIRPLSQLTALRNLLLSRNFISDISPLSRLTNLSTILALTGNSISDLSALQGLTSLRQLWIAENPVSDLGPLSALTNLERLHAYRALISDVAPLQYLTSLGWLELALNPNLSDIQPLIANTGLGSGDYVGLRSTSVSCTAVTALQAKGVTVGSDCP